ncbi:MAG: acetoacetate--CoA ligase [Planctomycetaceae bacterium]|nr:acetoacetate--CoA ligase [Planctomycetaceae bacterium]
MSNELLWNPSTSAADSEMAKYLRHAQQIFPEANICDYDSLYHWSIEHYADFWSDWLEYSHFKYEGQATPAIKGNGLRSTEFFPGIRLNFAENLLCLNDDTIAITNVSESRHTSDMSFAELRQQVGIIQAHLNESGIQIGDRVAAVIPNISEAVVAALASSASGAIWSSCSPDFGIQGVVDRLGQIEPKILITVNGYTHNGKIIDSRSKIKAIVAAIPSIETLVVIELVDLPSLDIPHVTWASWSDCQPTPPTFKQLPFNHPLYIMYSSGTTGKPKCIVHGAGGTLLQQVKELSLHCDVKAGDNVTYITTCGWMMWNWLIATLALGCRITLFDGFPAQPTISRLWDLIDELKITHFGTSPRFLAACRRRLTPRKSHELSSLRVIMSTGSPLLPEDFDWVYQSVKADLQLSSISGGTDIISCFMLGNPVLPVYRGEIQCLGLGMDVQAVDSAFIPLNKEKGELVCKTPFPSMPVRFWNDEDDQKYTDAYFTRREDRWCHGDLIELTGTQGRCGGVIVYGRSDATLNPGGIRIGTAEIYRVVEQLSAVEDSLVIGQPWRNDIRIVLYVKLRAGRHLTDELQQEIRVSLAERASARHVPGLIIEVEKIPYTRSGKKVELAVRDIAMGIEPSNRKVLQDPSAFDCFKKL